MLFVHAADSEFRWAQSHFTAFADEFDSKAQSSNSRNNKQNTYLSRSKVRVHGLNMDHTPYYYLHTNAAVADCLLAGAAGGQRCDGQRCRTGHGFKMLAVGWDSGGLRANTVWTGKVLTTLWERALPVGDPDGHLTPKVKPCQWSQITKKNTDRLKRQFLNTIQPPATKLTRVTFQTWNCKPCLSSIIHDHSCIRYEDSDISFAMSPSSGIMKWIFFLL